MYDKVIQALVSSKAQKATKFISPTEIVRAVRTTYRSRKTGKRSFGARASVRLEITLTHGKPNYLEREFIRKCKAAGEPFPVKKVQLKFAK